MPVVEEKYIGTIKVKRGIETKPPIKKRIAKAWRVIKEVYIFYEIVEKIVENFLTRHKNEGKYCSEECKHKAEKNKE